MKYQDRNGQPFRRITLSRARPRSARRARTECACVDCQLCEFILVRPHRAIKIVHGRENFPFFFPTGDRFSPRSTNTRRNSTSNAMIRCIYAGRCRTRVCPAEGDIMPQGYGLPAYTRAARSRCVHITQKKLMRWRPFSTDRPGAEHD